MIGLSLAAVALLFLSALVGVAWLENDAKPLLTRPRPDLTFPLALIGIAAGLFAARLMVRLPHIRERRARWVFHVLSPVYLGVGLPGMAEQAYEAVSFGTDVGPPELATALITEKDRSRGRRGNPDRYHVEVISPFEDRRVRLRVDETVFRLVEPYRHCVSLLTERASNGAVRLIEPRRWGAPCP